ADLAYVRLEGEDYNVSRGLRFTSTGGVLTTFVRYNLLADKSLYLGPDQRPTPVQLFVQGGHRPARRHQPARQPGEEGQLRHGLAQAGVRLLPQAGQALSALRLAGGVVVGYLREVAARRGAAQEHKQAGHFLLVAGKVLGAHRGFYFDYIFLAGRGLQGGQHLGGEGGVVEAHARLHGAHRDHGRVLGQVYLPAHDGLQGRDDFGGRHHRVDAAPGLGPVRAPAGYLNGEAVGAGHLAAGAVLDLAHRGRGPDVQAK
nr:hypothetical protein [Tanacetum cinerariifolium]